MTVADERLPTHRIALRATLGAAVAGLVAGPASLAPYLAIKSNDEGWFAYGTWKHLLVYASLFVAIRAFLVVAGEELVRHRSRRVRVLFPASLLLFVGYPLETWAMVWSGTSLGREVLTVHPLEVLPDVVARLTHLRVWVHQVLPLFPFWVLVVGRIWWGPTYGALGALAGGIVAVTVSVAIKGDASSVMHLCNWFLLPALATGLALGISFAAERRLLARVWR